MPTTNGILASALVGRQLSAVCFVMDYFQFEFDGNRLIVYSVPIATVNRESIAGFRDRLCAFIAHQITLVHEIKHQAMHIDFGSFGRISVPLDEESKATVEIAELIVDGKSVYMW
jgi:hypothetical protein